LTPVGSITVNPERQPSAQHIVAIRKKIVDNNAVCVFSEPQFEPSLVKTVTEGTGARVGVLDADGGIGIAPGPDAYFTIMQNLGDALKGCLAAPS
jgi:zinc transport system substrate-binding protein